MVAQFFFLDMVHFAKQMTLRITYNGNIFMLKANNSIIKRKTKKITAASHCTSQ